MWRRQRQERMSIILAAIFDDPQRATRVAEQLIEHDFPMDRISILRHAGGVGDDFLGVSYESERERLRFWGEQGAVWGALGGLLAGAMGLFLVPGVGPLLVLGPFVDAIAGAVAGGGLMTGAALVTRLTIALRRMGIPDEDLEYLHRSVMEGKTLLLLHYGSRDETDWRHAVSWSGAESVKVFAGTGAQRES